MSNWIVTYGDHTEIIPAPTYTKAAEIARDRACLGRPRWPTRADALAHGTGPALPCGEDHWHSSDMPAAGGELLGRDVMRKQDPPASAAAPADLARLRAHFARLDLDLEPAA